MLQEKVRRGRGREWDEKDDVFSDEREDFPFIKAASEGWLCVADPRKRHPLLTLTDVCRRP